MQLRAGKWNVALNANIHQNSINDSIEWHRALHFDTRMPPSEWSPYSICGLWSLTAAVWRVFRSKKFIPQKAYFHFGSFAHRRRRLWCRMRHTWRLQKKKPNHRINYYYLPSICRSDWATAEVRQQYYFIYMQINPIFSFALWRKHTHTHTKRIY